MSDRLNTFRQFVGPAQRSVLYSAMQGEEGEYFRAMVKDLIDHLETMPKTYEQDGKGDQAVVHLHYFTASCDWWITERDMEGEQHQAFGLADLGYGAELGYISIAELIANRAELDLHFPPRTIEQLTAERDSKREAA